MNDMEKTILGVMIVGLTGLYAFFIKHIIGHVNSESIKSNTDDIYRLYDGKQSKENCEQIVKRMDENHQETCKKLDRIWDKLENG